MEGDLRWCFGSSSNDWDLHAVVRSAAGCSGVTSPRASAESFSSLPLPPQPHKEYEEVTDAAALHLQQPLPISPAVDDLCLQQQALFAPPPPPQQPLANNKPPTRNSGVGGPTRSKRKKKKKSQASNKEVTRVAVGGASTADPWAWRKYGQKPIKGSPYPRGYYRCSTDKECRARKQVERCRTDPSTLLVSYAGEHSHPVPLHRNALAGTTRNKPPAREPSSTTSAAADAEQSLLLLEEEEDNTVAASLGLLEDAKIMEGRGRSGEDVLSLFLKPNSNDVVLFPEQHHHRLAPAPAVTKSSSRADDRIGAAPAAMNVTDDDEKGPFSGLTPWEAAAAAAAATNWG